MARYRMHTSGGCVGRVTGRNRVWERDQVITAPSGEFAALQRSEYTRLDVERMRSRPRAEHAVQPRPEQDRPPLDDHPVNATPTAISAAERYDIDLSSVTGTGAGGRITQADVIRAWREGG